jgi:hypothetical protein
MDNKQTKTAIASSNPSSWIIPPVFPGPNPLLVGNDLSIWESYLDMQNQPLLSVGQSFPSPPNDMVALSGLLPHQYPIQTTMPHQPSPSFSNHHPPPPYRISTTSVFSYSSNLSNAVLSPDRFAQSLIL